MCVLGGGRRGAGGEAQGYSGRIFPGSWDSLPILSGGQARAHALTLLGTSCLGSLQTLLPPAPGTLGCRCL